MFEPLNGPENPEEEEGDLDKKVKFLEQYGGIAKKDKFAENAYIIKFPFGEEAVSTIRIVFKDYSGADLVITNMTTLPDDNKGVGFGSRAIQSVLSWAEDNDLRDVRAVQVQREAENFWSKNGFSKLEGKNPTNDFAYRGQEKQK